MEQENIYCTSNLNKLYFTITNRNTKQRIRNTQKYGIP